MKTIEKNENRSSRLLKKIVVGSLVIGSLYGFSDYLSGATTGHLSSDLYLGRKSPTKIERKLISLINPNYSFSSEK